MNEEDYDDVLEIVEETVKDVLNGEEVRGWKEVEWGWAGRQ